MPRIWHPDRRQFAGAVKSRHGEGIPAIGLDVLARPLEDQGRRDDETSMAESSDLAMQAVASRPRLIAEQQLAEFSSQLAYQSPYRIWRVVDVAEKSGLALAALFGQGHGDLHLAGVKTNKNSAILLHGSSPVPEARRRPITRPPGSSRRVEEPHTHRQRTYSLPHVLNRVELGRFRRQGD